MTPKGFLLPVLLLCLLHSAGTSKPGYALTIPAVLNSGVIEKACFTFQDYEKALNINVVLEYAARNTTIFAGNVPPPEYSNCSDFQVPVVQADYPVYVWLSISGEGVKILQRYSVVIIVLKNIYLVQMDKPIYKPGQKVLFNLVSLNAELLPIDTTYPVVYLTDPLGSRIAQWLNQKSKNGFVSLEFDLIDDAIAGYYTITGQAGSNYPVYQSFDVEEYVLPRFDMTLDAPSTLSILDEAIYFNASAIYTYGEPVPGSLAIQWCRQPAYGLINNCFKDKNGVCFYKTAALASDGTYSGVLDLTNIQMDISGAATYLNLSVTVTETGTGIQVTKTQYMSVTSQLASISFDSNRMNQYYKRGISYSARVLLSDENGLPIVGEIVQLSIDFLPDTQEIRTGLDGSATYEIDTTNLLAPNFTITASYPNTAQCYSYSWPGPTYPTTQYTVFRFYSESGSFLQILPVQGTLKCGQKQKIDVQFSLSTAGVGIGATKATFRYLTMARTRIVQSGNQVVPLTNGTKGAFSFNLPIISKIAFQADLIVYMLLKRELIADTISLNVEPCFKNNVSLSFSNVVGPPASNVDLQISASPGSLCAVKVIDSSILLLNPDTGLTPETVYYALQNWYYGYIIGEFNVEEPAPPCEDPNTQIFYQGNYYIPVDSDSEGDTYNNLKDKSLIAGTNLNTRKPVVCPPPTYGIPVHRQLSMEDKATFSASTTGTIETVRKNFPDTWVWTMVPADSHGNGKITQKVPDTITEWTGSMICTSNKDGFGMTSSPSEFTTFLPFFIEMSLPYSFVRGETLVLNAFVSNYLNRCVKVLVTLAPSNSYTATLQGGGKQDVCICSGNRASYIWNINAKSLGVITFTVSAQTTYIGEKCNGPNDPSQPPRKDTVIQTVIVEAEGIKKEVTSSNLVCNQGKAPTTISIPMKLVLPQNVVQDSASAFITVLGDIIGLPLKNLQNLLQMPYGCGEQNLARMAPIPGVLDYLNTTGQLTKETLQQGIDYMNAGYYRELRYKSGSGGYSFFGSSNLQEDVWLTAYVFKTFEQCKKYIYIDPNIQQQTLIWLGNSQQLSSGCFKATPDSYMTWSGETNEDVRLTSFLVIALLESQYSIGMTLLDGALTCLLNALNTKQTIYNQAIMAYAFTLAKDWNRRSILLQSLKSKAISEGGVIYWESDDKPPVRPLGYFYPRYSSAEVTIASYILLSIALGPNVSHDDVTYMAQISVWLIRQQNAYGGFLSTQDTVMGLQALSTFAKLIYNINAQHVIRVKRQNTQVAQITTNKDNRLVVQRQSLSIPADYNIQVTGIGCCLTQTTVRYNVPVPQQNSAFALSLNTSKSCVNGVAYVFTIGITLSYRGNRPQTNMVIIDITMLSGYQADYWTLSQLELSKVIVNSETVNNHVILYLKPISNETIDFSFNVIMGNRVLNVKTASAYVYDYYETGENGYASYHHPCA
ncbi:ovostatin-like isoform X2 [Eleutherodactylus coqui]|uniref:ovostatin-like isoform X2 n=1 Tax=Eleutherodactylus coqui TaxID=57060 RepID=UPI00346328CB